MPSTLRIQWLWCCAEWLFLTGSAKVVGLGTLIVRNAVYRVLNFFWFVFNFGFGHCLVVFFVHVSLVRSSSRHWSQNTASHVSQGCTIDRLNWKERSRVSPSHLPVVFHPCPGSFPPLLAVIASGLGSPHGSRKQRSHFTSWYTFAHSGDDDACFTPRRASYLPQESSVSVTSCSFPRVC